MFFLFAEKFRALQHGSAGQIVASCDNFSESISVKTVGFDKAKSFSKTVFMQDLKALPEHMETEENLI